LERRPHKFDPARAGKLDRPERQRVLPNERVLGLLDLSGREVVVDYGAGSGVLTVPLARAAPEGVVHAVDESEEMLALLEERVSGTGLRNVRPHRIEANRVPLPGGSADRVLAVNLLHEVVGETALEEMRRLLKPEGFLLVVDWRADVERDAGPPAEVSLTPEQGRRMVEEAGFEVSPVAEDLAQHYAFRAWPLLDSPPPVP
jgi:ubiquinone/menaquinone biosynthesis C-methylase UbiE